MLKTKVEIEIREDSCNGAHSVLKGENIKIFAQSAAQWPLLGESEIWFPISNCVSNKDVRNWLISNGFLVMISKIFKIFGFGCDFE